MFHDTLADELSDKASLKLTEMLDSYDAQQLIVAEGLNTIASNGAEQATDEFLIGCAEEIIAAAQDFIHTMRK